MFPKLGPQLKQMPVSRALLNISFRVPSKGDLSTDSPHRAPTERGAVFPEPSIYLSKSPWNEPPTWSPMGPLWREMTISIAFFCTYPDLKKSHLSLKVLNKGSSLHVPSMGPLWRELLCLRSQWFIRHPSESLVEEHFHEMGGKYTVTIHGAPRGRKALHTIGCGVVPHVDRLWHCCHYPSAMQTSAWYFPHGLCRPELH